MPEKVLFDTDIGTDIDDAVCLAYLLAQPACELLGITTVSGEATRRAMLASALCQAAGKDVPIYPGAEEPLLTAQRQPQAQQAAALSDWPHRSTFPHGSAVEFLRQTVRANPGEVTLLAVGPLTNVGLLFRIDPEIPRLLKRLVLMCGQFFGRSPGRGRWNGTPIAIPMRQQLSMGVWLQPTGLTASTSPSRSACPPRRSARGSRRRCSNRWRPLPRFSSNVGTKSRFTIHLPPPRSLTTAFAHSRAVTCRLNWRARGWRATCIGRQTVKRVPIRSLIR